SEDLVHQPELDLAEALAAELGIEMRGPQAVRPDLLGQRLDRSRQAVGTELVDQRLQRPDPLALELAHPVQLGLKLRLGREIPGHLAASADYRGELFPGDGEEG